MSNFEIRRLREADLDVARRLFSLMVEAFGEDEGAAPLQDSYLRQLLPKDSFWALAAFHGTEIVGGLTAHTLPMTRSQELELFIYDLAVVASHRRKGVGRQLIEELRRSAAREGIYDIFVAADNEDDHALEFYRSIGGEPAAVTMFTFTGS